ncbi:hypothetical protein Pelo_5378 [Pelomyxa schiedti]|nr:hypothetical protein Pelo_5378 [Pelomyxa schiedti]
MNYHNGSIPFYVLPHLCRWGHQLFNSPNQQSTPSLPPHQHINNLPRHQQHQHSDNNETQATTTTAIDCVISAREQFLAVCVGALVPRCGRRSPARAWASPASLCEFGRAWVVYVSRQIGLSLPLSDDVTLNVWMGVSPTEGTVYCGAHQCAAASSPPPPPAEFSHSSYIRWIMGSLGGNMHAGVWDRAAVHIDDGEGNTASVMSWPGNIVSHLSACSCRWLAVVLEKEDRGAANWCSLEVWRVVNGELLQGGGGGGGGPARMPLGFLDSWYEGCSCLHDDVLLISATQEPYPECETAQVWFVDLKKSILQNSPAISRIVEFPGFRARNIILSDPITFLVSFGPNCALILPHDYSENAMTSHHSSWHQLPTVCCVGDHLICVLDGMSATRQYFKLPELDTPVLTLTADQVLESEPFHTWQGIVALKLDATSQIAILDVTSRSVLAVLSLGV